MADSGIVIVGAGQAGREVAAELRKLGFQGRIVLIGEEREVPYKRPPLSKAYLSGTMTREDLYLVPPDSYTSANIEFIGETRVVRIDRKNKLVELADGNKLPYDKLALATGGKPRALSFGDVVRPNVFTVRTIADIDAVRGYFAPGKKLVIVGGGFIGLEAAAVAVKHGLQVTLLESLPRVMARVTAPEVSSFFEEVHRKAGVDLRTGVQIQSIEGPPEKTQVVLGDGSRLDADFIIAGIGLIPSVELAAEAGLAIDNGIVVDEFTCTSDPDIVAAGDCTNHPSPFAGRRLRLESVQNATEQGRAAARTLMGKREPYHVVPWFWSDQYDLKLQMVGLSFGYDSIVLRGNPASRSFTAFYLREGRLIAADTINRLQDFAMAKRIITDNVQVDPVQLADEAVSLKSLLPPPKK